MSIASRLAIATRGFRGGEGGSGANRYICQESIFEEDVYNDILIALDLVDSSVEEINIDVPIVEEIAVEVEDIEIEGAC